MSGTVRESSRTTPLVSHDDVLVCGGGPAGVAAAIAAARTGARVRLLELHGCLGGVWTAGALAWIIDGAGKPGIMREISRALESRGGHGAAGPRDHAYDIECMKVVLDQLCAEAGVRVQLQTRVVSVLQHDGVISGVITESRSGRQAWTADVVVDTTGDGDVAALAGCGFDVGEPASGHTQPMSLMAILTGLSRAEMAPFTIANDIVRPGEEELLPVQRRARSKAALLAEIRRAGIEPSYRHPALFTIHDDVYTLMVNHEYGASAFDDAARLTDATMRARREIHEVVDALRALGGPWRGIRLVSTGEQIGIREARRVHGLYTVTRDDVLSGRRHDDAVTSVTFEIDVHALTAAEESGLERQAAELVPQSRTYDIPLRALVARDVDGLLMAGRCISGDFWAHASYRVTGNAVAMGEAAGVAAARCARESMTPRSLCDVRGDERPAGI